MGHGLEKKKTMLETKIQEQEQKKTKKIVNINLQLRTLFSNGMFKDIYDSFLKKRKEKKRKYIY